MAHGSILPFVSQLAAKAGSLDGLKAENFLAREILLTGTTLAALLDEFHPAGIMFSAAVERLVRRLFVLEESMEVDKDGLSKFYRSRLAFMGIGGGARGQTRELFKA